MATVRDPSRGDSVPEGDGRVGQPLGSGTWPGPDWTCSQAAGQMEGIGEGFLVVPPAVPAQRGVDDVPFFFKEKSSLLVGFNIKVRVTWLQTAWSWAHSR